MLRITADAEGQQLKTDSSQREIPIHDQVLACGFLAFVEHRRKMGQDRLFPEERRSGKGEFSAFSKRINRRMRNLGIVGNPKHRKDFYSLRHTVIEKLKHAAVQEYVITSLTGHASDDRPLAFTTYGTGAIPAETKHAELSKLSYGFQPTLRWAP